MSGGPLKKTSLRSEVELNWCPSVISKKRTTGGSQNISKNRFVQRLRVLIGTQTMFSSPVDPLILRPEYSPLSSKKSIKKTWNRRHGVERTLPELSSQSSLVVEVLTLF